MFYKYFFRPIDVMMYWIVVLIAPIILAGAVVVFVDPLFQWKTGLLLTMCLLLAYRDFKLERSVHDEIIVSDYYIVPLDPVNEEINNAVEDYFCRHKIKTKKVWINERLKPSKPEGPTNTKHTG